MAKKNEELATPAPAALATRADLPDYLQGTASLGNENVTAQDLTIARIGIIQALSPERKKSDAKYIEGAEEGQFFNSVTRKLLDTKIKFVALDYLKSWGVFVHRDFGGGFKGAFRTELEANNFAAGEANHAQLEVIETGVHIIQLLDESNRPTEVAMLMMKKGSLKVSRQINTIIKNSGAARFATLWELGTVEETAPKGTFFNYKPASLGFVDKDLFDYCKKAFEEISKKDLMAAANKAEAAANSDETEY